MEKRAACEEKDILLQDIGPWSQLSPPKHLPLPGPTFQGWSRDDYIPSASTETRGQLGDTQGRLFPAQICV